MPDIIDDLSVKMEAILQSNINAVRRPERTPLVSKGVCHYCEEPIEKGPFCDKDCADDYTKYVERRP